MEDEVGPPMVYGQEVSWRIMMMKRRKRIRRMVRRKWRRRLIRREAAAEGSGVGPEFATRVVVRRRMR